MLLALLTMILAQVLDLTTFVLMVARRTAAAEANPMVAGLLGTVGVPGLVFGKLAIMLLVGSLGLLVLAKGWRGRRALPGVLPMAAAIVAGLIGGVTDAVAYPRLGGGLPFPPARGARRRPGRRRPADPPHD